MVSSDNFKKNKEANARFKQSSSDLEKQVEILREYLAQEFAGPDSFAAFHTTGKDYKKTDLLLRNLPIKLYLNTGQLTDEELNKSFDGAFDIPVAIDHKPTPEEIFTFRLRAVAKAARAKLVSVGEL